LDPQRLTIRHAGGYIEPSSFIGGHFGRGAAATTAAFGTPRDVEFVTAAAMALRAEALRNVGVFNEVFSPGYYEDVELCTRLRRAGWLVQYRPEAIATHVESGSFGEGVGRLALSHRNRILYALPWLEAADARHAFLIAEQQFIDNVASDTERRALGLAYLAALLRLPAAAHARQLDRPPSPEHIAGLVGTLAVLRRFVTERPHRTM
jgi:GT2 family glycosyltransferase